MSAIYELFVGNDTVLEVQGLRSDVTGEPQNTATLSVTLLDARGAEVAGQAWPMPMPYVEGSNGLYRVLLPSTLPLVPDVRYLARIVADAGQGLVGTWNMECVGRTRN
jgi:hypothetical protein